MGYETWFVLAYILDIMQKNTHLMESVGMQKPIIQCPSFRAVALGSKDFLGIPFRCYIPTNHGSKCI